MLPENDNEKQLARLKAEGQEERGCDGRGAKTGRRLLEQIKKRKSIFKRRD